MAKRTPRPDRRVLGFEVDDFEAGARVISRSVTRSAVLPMWRPSCRFGGGQVREIVFDPES